MERNETRGRKPLPEPVVREILEDAAQVREDGKPVFTLAQIAARRGVSVTAVSMYVRIGAHKEKAPGLDTGGPATPTEADAVDCESNANQHTSA
jgi:hypothetical protein